MWDIQRACSHALGGDVVVELMGSQVRGTSCFKDYDGDLDMQVSRRPGSERSHEPFTETDRQRVAQNLEKLPFITNVRIGNIAIKFVIHSMKNVDLVLWRERPEEFPALRGGPNFHQNSKRIDAFLDQEPAAKNAIVAIKRYFGRGRPKGILLEAIAWRLGTMKVDLETFSKGVPGLEDLYELQLMRNSFTLFTAMYEDIRNWRRAPHFGHELQQDLDMLSEKKRDEYTAGFEEIARVNCNEFCFQLLLRCI